MAAKKYIYLCLSAIIATSGVVFGLASAQTALSDDQIKQITGSCLSTKNTLNQLHASDALLRVNRGQIYESIYAKLMSRFSTRVLNNKLDNSNLALSANEFSTTLNTFRSDYIAYEGQLTKTIEIDCIKSPVQFYEATTLSRTKREIVHSDIVKLNQQIDSYRLAVDQFEATLLSDLGGTQ